MNERYISSRNVSTPDYVTDLSSADVIAKRESSGTKRTAASSAETALGELRFPERSERGDSRRVFTRIEQGPRRVELLSRYDTRSFVSNSRKTTHKLDKRVERELNPDE